MLSPVIGSPFEHAAVPPLAGRTVLQIIPSLLGDGAARVTLEIAGALAEAGARALVATVGGRLVSELQARGGVWIPFPADARNPLAMLRNVRTLARLIQVERPSIVHAQSRAAAWVALGATRLTGTPFVTTFHGSYAGRHAVKLRYNSVMARGNAVLVNSHFTGETIVGLYPWARNRVRVIWPGIDLRTFSPGAIDLTRVVALRQNWGVEPDQRIVLMAGRLADSKEHRVLVEATALLKERGRTDIVVVLAGDPPGRRTYGVGLDTLSNQRGVAERVRRVGYCADMPAAFLAASVVVVSSIRPESFGLTAIEAQAMGKPVVVSNLGAVAESVLAEPEVQPENATALRVPPDDPGALADAIERVLDLGASALEALATRARAHVEQHFGKDHMTEAVLDAYCAVLDAHAAAEARRAA